MTDYNTNESVIYKIHCLDNSCDYVYFGSTINYTNRREGHKSVCNNIKSKGYNYKLYETIREHGGLENWIMEIVEVFPCESMRDLHMREQEFIDSEKNNINSFRAFRTPEERKVFGKERGRKYRIANKDKIKKYQKQYRLASNKDEKREKNRLYNLANRDKINERKRLYYLANKERLLEDKNQIESI